MISGTGPGAGEKGDNAIRLTGPAAGATLPKPYLPPSSSMNRRCREVSSPIVLQLAKAFVP